MFRSESDDQIDENRLIVRPMHPRGVPQSQSSFPRGRSNFSSGTLPNRKHESIPVNTLATAHSNKMLVTYRCCAGGSRPRLDAAAEEDSTEPGLSNRSEFHANHVNNLSCPINRAFLQDYHLFPQRPKLELPFGLPSSRNRFSLPSTHILFEKTRHRGGANVEEQEKVAKMLRAAVPADAPKPIVMIDELPPIEMVLDVKLIGPMDDNMFGYVRAHMEHMKEFFEKWLKESDATEITWTKTGSVPRAAYEHQLYMLEARLKLTGSPDLHHETMLFAEFARKFSARASGMLHDQVFLEVNRLHNHFPDVTPEHSNVDVANIAIGNCINPGLFFVRGDYISQENTVCSVKLQSHNANDAARDHNMFKVAGSNKYLSYARFEHDKRVMVVYFGVRLLEFADDGLDHAGFRLNLYYNTFVQICVDLSQEHTNSIYIQLKHPPQLWEGIPRNSLSHPSKSKVLNMETCTEWMRVLSWPGDAEQRGVGCTVDAFSQSNWIRVTFRKDEEDGVFPTAQLIRIAARLSARSNAKVMFGPIFSIRRKLAPSPALHSLGTFRADYALQALITRGSIFLDQLFDVADEHIPTEPGVPMEKEHEPRFLKLVRRGMAECTPAAEESLEQLLNAFDERRSIHVVRAFDHLYTGRRRQYERLLSGESVHDIGLAKPLPKNCVAVAKVIVTPSRVLLMAPEVMMVNRVVRRFGPEYALRCVFRDDNLGRLAIRDFSINNIDHMSNTVTESIYHTLRNGIQVGSRLYSFLGWSNSQMRDQGCYLYAPKVDPTTGNVSGSVDEIRAWMGDFRDAVSVPKMMSRMGQCFTQAQPTVRLQRKHWIVEPDIEGGIDNKYCFSDGCGRISFKVARQISRLLDLAEVPACFQVRFKGFKGILVIDPTIDEIVNMPKVIFRKSQQKFGEGAGDLQDDYLEVVKYAMPSPVCLNRPFITILDQVSAKQSSRSHRRITNRVHYYLERELCLLSNMLINENQAAEELVNRTNLPIDWIQASKHAGFQLCVDPFVRAMIFSVYRYNIVHHISKAKIFLPPNMGRSMYGVVDETGLLQHGQVFIQYSPSIRQTSRKPILKTGKVLITKNPCHVPGDVRIFDAVWQPALSHLVDVVVFPQHGPRPHPDEMAGSDLDGDEYSVIWDQEMLLDHNEPAMVFPSSPGSGEEEKEPSTDDMIEFFLRYLQQDSIGRMSHAHLAFADFWGLFHEKCHSIALKCAVAVDFPKSGIPAEPLLQDEQCDMTPDYMMSGGKPMYYSPRLNGQLHRKARKVEEILEENESRQSVFEGDYDKLICPDDFDVFFGNETKLFAAMSIRDEYASRIQQLLDEYGIEDEASIVSGHAASIKRLAGMERDDYSFYHTDKIVELRYEKMFRAFRGKFFEEFGGEAAYVVPDARRGAAKKIQVTAAMREKARQWYYVAYVQPRKNRTGKIIGQSLPWVAWEALCSMRRALLLEREHALVRVKYPIAGRLEEEIVRTIEQQSAQFAEFQFTIAHTPQGEYLRRYASVYGPQLVQLLFVIKNWLEREKVLPSSCLKIWHVGRLLVRFALGALQGNPTIDYEKTILGAPEKVFAQWLTREEPGPHDEEPISTHFNMATLLIEFLRYLSSQSFALSESMPLRVFTDAGLFEPVLFRPFQWIPLHHVAYRTFHSVAVSGRFESLHLWSDGELVDLITESRDPILVNESLFVVKSYNDNNPISRTQIVRALMKWSGVQDIITRNLTGNSRQAQLLYVTSVGTVLAKQRLARLLMLSGETIRDAIANDVVPAEVRDEFM